jgi:hypothetical protein
MRNLDIERIKKSLRQIILIIINNIYILNEILEINEGTSRSNFMKARVKLQSLVQKEFPHLYKDYHQETGKHSTK